MNGKSISYVNRSKLKSKIKKKKKEKRKKKEELVSKKLYLYKI